MTTILPRGPGYASVVSHTDTAADLMETGADGDTRAVTELLTGIPRLGPVAEEATLR